MGRTKFFDVFLGYFNLWVGKGRQASDILEGEIEKIGSIKFHIENGWRWIIVKVVLKEIVKE